jgi:hypothetical protein
MFTRRPSRAQSLVVAALCLAAAGVAAPGRAQSLADVAKKEEERRRKLPEPTKVYTNKDLKGGVEPPPPPPAQTSAPAGETPKSGATDAKAKPAEKDVTKDPAYWGNKITELKTKLEQDQTYAEAMQSRVNGLTTDFANRDDPAQRAKVERDRQKALADLANLTKAIVDDKKAIADFEERARQAGIPPGWMR